MEVIMGAAYQSPLLSLSLSHTTQREKYDVVSVQGMCGTFVLISCGDTKTINTQLGL